MTEKFWPWTRKPRGATRDMTMGHVWVGQDGRLQLDPEDDYYGGALSQDDSLEVALAILATAPRSRKALQEVYEKEGKMCGACERGDHADCSGWCFCRICREAG